MALVYQGLQGVALKFLSPTDTIPGCNHAFVHQCTHKKPMKQPLIYSNRLKKKKRKNSLFDVFSSEWISFYLHALTSWTRGKAHPILQHFEKFQTNTRKLIGKDFLNLRIWLKCISEFQFMIMAHENFKTIQCLFQKCCHLILLRFN